MAKRLHIPNPPQDVSAVFEAYPPRARKLLLGIRKLIFETAQDLPGVGAIRETLKWAEPAYLTDVSRSGTTIRLAWSPKRPDTAGLYVNCQTSLVDSWRQQYDGALEFSGNREIRFTLGQTPPAEPLRHCIAMALTYHKRKSAP